MTLERPGFVETYLRPGSALFWAMHVGAVYGVAKLGFSWSGVLLCAVAYYVRMFFVTAGYHRYFSHRTFRTSRWFQFVLAFGAQTSSQKGVLWWGAHHRWHHRYSDTPQDVHSPVQDGFWWSHFGWILSPVYSETRMDDIKDMARYPELRFLNRHWTLPPILFAVTLLALGGWHALVWGFAVSTVVLWHGTFTINSLSHVFGARRYDTTDDSRNNWMLTLITLGEGWHNNHHHYQGTVKQGFFWWEIDITYYILRALSWVGIVSNLRMPPAHILDVATRKPQRAHLVQQHVTAAARGAATLAKKLTSEVTGNPATSLQAALARRDSALHP